MNKTILTAINKSSLKYKDKIAIIEDGKSITYSEFNAKSNQLANLLREKGVINNCIVPVIMDRNINLMITLFAIMKAGGAYLPISTDYPKDRLEIILQDANSILIITEEKHKTLTQENEKVLIFENLNFYNYSNKNLEIITKGTDLAYVIYTSGSTGKPKGVAIEHNGLYNRLMWMQKAYPINSNESLFFKTVYTFDVSVWEIFWWSMYGSSLVLLPNGKEHNIHLIYNLMIKHKINVVHFVPSVFKLFIEYIEFKGISEISENLKYIFTSGEKLLSESVNLFNNLFSKAPSVLINLYGPTEASIDVTHYCFEDKSINYHEVPIGKAIDNINLHILDDNLQEVKLGEKGELYISGIGLSRGYLNDTKLTNEKFIYKNNTTRMYKTGDIVYQHQITKLIYFIGRKDFQVKLRGLRIELSDIEFHINQIPNIKESVVMMIDSEENQFLYAFYRSSESIDTNHLKELLKIKINLYMVPNFFIHTKEFPLLENGKLDRKKLKTFIKN